jgi:hypothetical protein
LISNFMFTSYRSVYHCFFNVNRDFRIISYTFLVMFTPSSNDNEEKKNDSSTFFSSFFERDMQSDSYWKSWNFSTVYQKNKLNIIHLIHFLWYIFFVRGFFSVKFEYNVTHFYRKMQIISTILFVKDFLFIWFDFLKS